MLDFYRLREEPFGIAPDPRFLYLGSSHREALASLFYGIQYARDFQVVTAEPGLGKTTLVNQIRERSRAECRSVYLFPTQWKAREILKYLLTALDVRVEGLDRVDMHNELGAVLRQEKARGRRVLLIIDEAQHLSIKALETIRLLSNFETSGAGLIQIMLVGQPLLAHKLALPQLEQLRQRVSTFTSLQPLTPEETRHYIDHRLKIAGYSGDKLFSDKAITAIYRGSSGIPRNINRICFAALSLGYAMDRRLIEEDMVGEVTIDLHLKSSQPAGSPALTGFPDPGDSGPGQLDPAHPQPRSILKEAPEETSPQLDQPENKVRSIRRRASGAALAIVAALGAALYIGKQHSAPQISSAGIAKAAKVLKPASPPWAVPAVSPAPGAAASSRAIRQDGVIKVKARPGDSLAQIALRNLGSNDNVMLRIIQELNPGIDNPNRILVDQEIRLPLIARWIGQPAKRMHD